MRGRLASESAGDSYRLKESAGRRRASAMKPETGEITEG